MKSNNLERLLETVREGRPALGAVTTFTDAAATELVANAGFDFVWIDGEHGSTDRTVAEHHLMAVNGSGCASFYRVPSCDHTEIKRVIDVAPAGVIVPMVMTADDAARAVSACRYPIHGGDRGCSFRRQVGYGAGDVAAYLEQSAKEPLVILQLEHIEAARNLDAILAVPGVDAVIVGPYDFTMSMKKPGQWHDPEVIAVLDECCRKVRAAGKILGVYSECDFARWMRRGVQLFAIKCDYNAMLLGLDRMREIFRSETDFQHQPRR